jgi:hypothetical protein
MTSVFLLRYREARKLPHNPYWSPSQGSSCKGQAPGRVITPWKALALPHAQVGLQNAPPKPLPVVFTIKLLAKLLLASFPLVHGDGHTTNTVGVVSQDYKPLWYTTMVHTSTELLEVCRTLQQPQNGEPWGYKYIASPKKLAAGNKYIDSAYPSDSPMHGHRTNDVSVWCHCSN